MEHEFKAVVVDQNTFDCVKLGDTTGALGTPDVPGVGPGWIIEDAWTPENNGKEYVLLLSRPKPDEPEIDWEAAYRKMRKSVKIVQNTGQVPGGHLLRAVGRRDEIIQGAVNQMVFAVLESAGQHRLAEAEYHVDDNGNINIKAWLFGIARDDWDALPVPPVVEEG
jgi:hypothetical protein